MKKALFSAFQLIIISICMANAADSSTNTRPENFLQYEEDPSEGKMLLLENTISPSKKYIFSVCQTAKGPQLHLLSPKTYKDLLPPIDLSDEYIFRHDSLGSTQALWSPDESRVALSTQSRPNGYVYIFTIEHGKMAAIKTPSREKNISLLKKKFPKITNIYRLWIDFDSNSKWISKNSVTLQYSGDDPEIGDCTWIWKIQKNNTIEVLSSGKQSRN